MDAQDCNILDQLDPDTKNLNALQAVTVKLAEVSTALKRCQEITEKLSQAVDIVSKNYAFSQIERIGEHLKKFNTQT
ncbi:MAG: hypothetical protein U9Q84_00465 [Thermodesulfobacteriota bacterium]|nr:hypothetical protein [Thermodesulfobacteriota bacterium]